MVRFSFVITIYVFGFTACGWAQDITSEPEQTETVDLADVPQEVTEWIENLGADEFAVREQAASNLVGFGIEVVPYLRVVAETTSDPEVRLRTEQMIRKMSEGDMQARIDSFLRGDDLPFDGWDEARQFMGDTLSVRELFVELMKEHPALTKSLEGTSRERYIAMESVMTHVQSKMYEKLQHPSRADAIALLLPANDENVPIDKSFENLMLSVLRKASASKLHRDVALAGPFDALVTGWANRTSQENRAEIIFFALTWDLDGILGLSRKTLGESVSVDAVTVALQAIARFGDPTDTGFVVELLEDDRVVSRRGFARGEQVETQVGDVAMMTLAVLHNVTPKQLGFENAQSHPTLGFLLEDIGFPNSEEQKREAAREKIRKLIFDDNAQSSLPNDQSS